MAAPVLLDVLIEAKLLELVAAGTFHVIAYAENGTPSPEVDEDENAVTLLPKEKNAYPIGSAFQHDTNNGRAWRSRRSEWAWGISAFWERRVSLETFEKARRTPTFIERDDLNGIEHRVELRWAKAYYAMWPRGGTQLTPSLLATFQPGKAAMRVTWNVQAVLLP